MGAGSHVGRGFLEVAASEELKDEERVAKSQAEGGASDGKTDTDEELEKKNPGISESLMVRRSPLLPPHTRGLAPRGQGHPRFLLDAQGASGNLVLSKQPVVPKASVKCEQDLGGYLVPKHPSSLYVVQNLLVCLP